MMFSIKKKNDYSELSTLRSITDNSNSSYEKIIHTYIHTYNVGDSYTVENIGVIHFIIIASYINYHKQTKYSTDSNSV